MDLNFSINWYLVGAGTLLSMLIGMLWYSPLLFCNIWLKAVRLKKEDMAASRASHFPAYTVSVLAHAILSLVLGVMVLNLNIHGFQYGMILGLLFWLGFNCTSVIKYVFFEKRPWILFLMNAGYDIICFALIGGIFAQWQ